MSRTIRFFTTFIISTFAVAACSDSSGTGTGLLTVRLTDAPFPFSQVKSVDVYIVRVDARKDEPTDAEATDENDQDGWITVAGPPPGSTTIPAIGFVNLLDLNGGKARNLGATTLATGTYNGFRLIIDPSQSSITLADGTKPPIAFPSAGHSGIKVSLDEPIQLTKDGEDMFLDFDIGRSFVMRGNNPANGFNFKPVIRAVARFTGSVSGSVHANSATGAAVPNATVEVLKTGSALDDTQATDVVATTTTATDGTFGIRFLLPGSYVLRATPPTASGFKPALLPGGLTITSGATTADQVIVVAP